MRVVNASEIVTTSAGTRNLLVPIRRVTAVVAGPAPRGPQRYEPAAPGQRGRLVDILV